MRLYRGQPTTAAIADAASRRSPWLSDAMEARLGEPAGRAQGRWFTDDVAIARWYVEDVSTRPGMAEVVAIDVPDALTETFRVSNTPETDCGLSPGRFSRDPKREFLLPRDMADRAVPLETSEVGVDRSHPIRDNSLFGGKIMADAPTITYEGIDHSEHEAMFRKDYAMPGERLRVNPSAKIHDVDMKELETKLGTDALTISKTVMTGVHEKDIIGGERTMVIPTYEFEGVEGRYSAKAFQHELGESGAHAIVAVRDGEMWSVPMTTNGKGEMTDVEGPAREIVGFTGRHLDNLHPEGVEGLKTEIGSEGNQAVIADVYSRNAVAFEDRTGPINVVAMPMVYGAPNEREMALASPAIDTAIFEKRIGEVARDSEALLRVGGMEDQDGRERSEITDLVDALDARKREPSMKNGGYVLDAANATLGMMDDNSMSSRPVFDKLAYSVEAAERAGDAVLRHRYADLGLEPAVARQMEALSKQHDEAMDAPKPSAPNQAARGAAMASQAGRGV